MYDHIYLNEDEYAEMLMSSRAWSFMTLDERRRCIVYIIKTSRSDAEAETRMKNDLGIRVTSTKMRTGREVIDPSKDLVVGNLLMTTEKV